MHDELSYREGRSISVASTVLRVRERCSNQRKEPTKKHEYGSLSPVLFRGWKIMVQRPQYFGTYTAIVRR